MEDEKQFINGASIARSLGALTEAEFCDLFRITPLTAKSWRQRGIAPMPVLIGNGWLYPLDAIKEEMQKRVREPRQVAGKKVGVLA